MRHHRFLSPSGDMADVEEVLKQITTTRPASPTCGGSLIEFRGSYRQWHTLDARLPAHQVGGMVKPLAKLISMLTPKRRWAQFSLASMFVIVAVLCAGLSLVVVPAERHRRAVAAIDALRGSVEYVELNPVEPGQQTSEASPKPFLRRWLPWDYFDKVRWVSLNGTPVTDAGLAHLHGLTGLQALSLDGTQVTDDGLAHLQGLTALEYIDLSGTQVTDDGLAHLQALAGLQALHLNCTPVTDAGPAHLHGLTGCKRFRSTAPKLRTTGWRTWMG